MSLKNVLYCACNTPTDMTAVASTNVGAVASYMTNSTKLDTIDYMVNN